jgi:hypothetical protein
LRLGASVPKKLRCAAAVPSEIETIHQFRGVGLGVGGKDAFLVVTTECLKKDECASDAERVVTNVWIQSARIEAPTCPLDPSVQLTTGLGLRLGDSAAKVRELYGKPHREKPAKGPLKSVEYSGRRSLAGLEWVEGGLLNVGFTATFKNGRVDGMTIFIDTDPH